MDLFTAIEKSWPYLVVGAPGACVVIKNLLGRDAAKRKAALDAEEAKASLMLKVQEVARRMVMMSVEEVARLRSGWPASRPSSEICNGSTPA